MSDVEKVKERTEIRRKLVLIIRTFWFDIPILLSQIGLFPNENMTISISIFITCNHCRSFILILFSADIYVENVNRLDYI